MPPPSRSQPVNDAPVAMNDSFTAIEDTVLNIHAPGVLGNDSDIDGDNLTAVKLSDPTHGTLTLNADGSLLYTPAPYFNGADSFTYRANDGTANSNTATVRLNVSAVNNAPVCSTVSLTLNEDTTGEAAPACTDVEGDTMSYSILAPPSHGVVLVVSGKLRYTPKTNYNGADSFTYKANDGSLDSNISAGSVSVTPVNDAPLLSPIGDKAVNEMSLLSFSAHATDVDGDKLSFSLDSGAPVGASIQPDSGLFSWTPAKLRDQAPTRSPSAFPMARRLTLRRSLSPSPR